MHYPGHQKVLSLILLVQLQNMFKLVKCYFSPLLKYQANKYQASRKTITSILQKHSGFIFYQFQLQHGTLNVQTWTLHYQCILLFCQNYFLTEISNAQGNLAWDEDSRYRAQVHKAWQQLSLCSFHRTSCFCIVCNYFKSQGLSRHTIMLLSSTQNLS